MSLLFPLADIIELLDHAENAPTSSLCHGEDRRGGLLLVGDQGVYLMSNGVPILQRPGAPAGHSKVVYANGINPNTDEDWYDRKRATFGGDDGAEFIDAAAVRTLIKQFPDATHLDVALTPTTIGFSVATILQGETV